MRDLCLVISPDPTTPGRWLAPECLGVYVLDAFLKQHGRSISVIDAYMHRLTPEQIGVRIAAVGARCTAIQLMSPWTAGIVLEAIRYARCHGYGGLIGVGGNYASLDSTYLIRNFPEMDFVVVGDGEIPLLELTSPDSKLEDVAGVATKRHPEPTPAEQIGDLDLLPYASRPFAKRLTAAGIPLSLSKSRGCFRNCEFCSVAAFRKVGSAHPWRSRSPRNIVGEMLSLRSLYGADQFIFVDDNFVGPSSSDRLALHEFCDLLIQSSERLTFAIETHPRDVQLELFERLRLAGLGFVAIGFESGSDHQLRRMRKASQVVHNHLACSVLKELRVPAYLNTILMDDGSEISELYETLDVLEKYSDWFTFNLIGHAEARVGTPMFDRLRPYLDEKDRCRPHYQFRDPGLARVADAFLQATSGLYMLTQDLWRALWFEWRAVQRLGSYEIVDHSPVRLLVAEKNRHTLRIAREMITRVYPETDKTRFDSAIVDVKQEVREVRRALNERIDLVYLWIAYLYDLCGLRLPQTAPSDSPTTGNIENAMVEEVSRA